VFAGTPEFAVPALDALLTAGHTIAAVYTQPDRPSGRGLGVAAGPVKRRAIEHGLAIEQPVSLRDERAVEQLRRYAPEVMVVVAYVSPCSVNVLTPALGCVNIHASLLPRWRGAAPIQRAIECGDEETGVTIMKMDAGLDTGPILLARRTSIGRDETSGTLHDRLAQLGGIAIVDALAEWTAGRIAPRPQPEQGVTCAAKIRKDEAAIDWSQPAATSTRKCARSISSRSP
jgi:methionyl-tRNA formyltransferase